MDQCKSTLSTPRQKLLGIMRQLYFGTIEELVIRGNEPSFNPPPKVTQEIKLGIDDTKQLVLADRDFAVKRSVIDLFANFDGLSDGSVVTIEVRHGLPARLILTCAV